MPNLNKAYNEAIELCESTNPYCRYSQATSLRGGGYKNGYRWFDCSGFIWRILKDNGFNVGTTPFSTASEVGVLKRAGFTEENINGTWEKGDVLWRREGTHGHTEMVYRGGVAKGITMGAHTSNTTIPKEVSINSKYSTASSYMKLLRYGGGVDPHEDLNWVYRGATEYLNEAQMHNNAIIIYRYFYRRGWTLNAICGMLGNFMYESRYLNPRAESTNGSHRGLAQWITDYMYNIMDVLFGSHTNWWEGYNQCEMIYAQYEEYIGTQHRGIDVEWQTTTTYPVRWEDWSTSTADVSYLARVFNFNYEKSGATAEQREIFARQIYEFLLTVDPNGDGGEGSSIKTLPIWMMTRRIL